MKIVMFYHSLVSDWNHGNAHFLRGITSELLNEGHDVEVFEPVDGWSRSGMIEHYGHAPMREFEAAYPELRSNLYDPRFFRPEVVVRDADLVIVHEWNTPELVEEIGRLRSGSSYVLLFHDTHHRMVTAPNSMERYDLSHYDGVLAFGAVLRDLYLSRYDRMRAWVWHEAADVRRFEPMRSTVKEGDLVWIGNWGDEERTEELYEFLIEPVRSLGLKATVYGVRYPDAALDSLTNAGITYQGWLPNFRVPEVFSKYEVTVHIPRRPYAEALRGIPTIRPFEALACGIPLVSAPWDDSEHLFTPGEDFTIVQDGAEMEAQLQWLLADEELRSTYSRHGLETIRKKHTCAHRVHELMAIYEEVRAEEPLMEPC
jgi:spore maturation protein CgeB